MIGAIFSASPASTIVNPISRETARELPHPQGHAQDWKTPRTNCTSWRSSFRASPRPSKSERDGKDHCVIWTTNTAKPSSARPTATRTRFKDPVFLEHVARGLLDAGRWTRNSLQAYTTQASQSAIGPALRFDAVEVLLSSKRQLFTGTGEAMIRSPMTFSAFTFSSICATYTVPSSWAATVAIANGWAGVIARAIFRQSALPDCLPGLGSVRAPTRSRTV